ncbi:helix-turn-helix domain-containing protein [Clostridium lundense]|uniref:helix-turn-helix domain-containing protein n=1 Tax=Clostridium lundense TaxID=319475 RepID=UPI000687E978|nr:helix-turn-helix domain-containing protein [Clostridium lundense]
MGRKAKISFEEKYKAIEDYLSHKKSVSELPRKYQVALTSVRGLIHNYQSMGIDGLITVSSNSSYSEELKLSAIQNYLSSKGSQEAICKKYAIRPRVILRNWILKYNSHQKIKSSRTGGESIMTKGRSTTFNERIEIVKYCIEHKKTIMKLLKNVRYHTSKCVVGL